jgi:hypothetical protein
VAAPAPATTILPLPSLVRSALSSLPRPPSRSHLYDGSITVGFPIRSRCSSPSVERIWVACQLQPWWRQSEFFLVISFGQCEHRLHPQSVGYFLQVTIGGSAGDFKVFQLADRVFRLSIFSKQVGFFIVNLRSFECSDFKDYFHLWNSGGLNWVKEFSLFQEEEASSWILPPRIASDRRSYADVARLPGPLKLPCQQRNHGALELCRYQLLPLASRS